MIEGVKITPLKQIKDERGKIMHMMRNDNPVFEKFGEIYFSTINPKAIKAWHLHKEATLNYACIKGEVNLVLYDDRDKSVTCGKYQNLILSPKKYFCIVKIWMRSCEYNDNTLLNCPEIPMESCIFKKHQE